MNLPKHTDEKMAQLTALFLDATKRAEQLQSVCNWQTQRIEEMANQIKTLEMKAKSQAFEECGE